MQTPFYRSIRVTAQLPAGSAAFSVYSIIRGTVNVPITINGFTLPPTARMQTVTNTNLTVESLHFVPIVNMTGSKRSSNDGGGGGMVLGHTVAIQGHPSFTYLEGCFHLITPYTLPLRTFGVSNNFPGTVRARGLAQRRVYSLCRAVCHAVLCCALLCGTVRPNRDMHTLTCLSCTMHTSNVCIARQVLSTGMEDYYDSSFYFHAGENAYRST